MMFPITVSGSAGLSLGRSRPYHGRHRQHAGRPLIPCAMFSGWEELKIKRERINFTPPQG
ncbi:hypothetical protein LINPERHAP1_LOCUS13953 [Linum perenne]